MSQLMAQCFTVDTVTNGRASEDLLEFDRFSSMMDIDKIRQFLTESGIPLEVITSSQDLFVVYKGALITVITSFYEGCSKFDFMLDQLATIEFMRLMY